MVQRGVRRVVDYHPGAVLIHPLFRPLTLSDMESMRFFSFVPARPSGVGGEAGRARGRPLARSPRGHPGDPRGRAAAADGTVAPGMRAMVGGTHPLGSARGRSHWGDRARRCESSVAKGRHPRGVGGEGGAGALDAGGGGGVESRREARLERRGVSSESRIMSRIMTMTQTDILRILYIFGFIALAARNP